VNALFEQYRVAVIAVAAVVLLSLAAGIGWTLNGWRLAGQVSAAQAQTERERSAHHADLAAISNAAAHQVSVALARQQATQQRLAALDQKSNEELRNANAENDRLRSRLAAGGRVRVAGSCPAATGAVPATGTSASATLMDDAGAVELAPAAGRNVLDIRAGVLADQAALSALQQYVREVCLAR
jgi:prophage endopeptidase